MKTKNKDISWKKYLLVAIILTIFATFFLTGCGAYHPARIQQRDDLKYRVEESQTNRIVATNGLATEQDRFEFDMEKEAMSFISSKYAVPMPERGYRGFVQNLLYDGKIRRYKIYLNKKLVTEFELKQGWQQELFLPPGFYRLVCDREGISSLGVVIWIHDYTAEFQVRNYPTAGSYFFKITGNKTKY